MNLRSNPFYILKISCTAGRRDVMSAAEALNLLLDSEDVSYAQNELINLSKRSLAEINWFPNADEDILSEIIKSIDGGNPISTDELISIDRLNASLYNFTISESTDAYELGFDILDLDEQYSSLDNNEIAEAINKNRREAGLPTIQPEDVENGLIQKRNEIKLAVTEKLSVLEQDSYIELVTIIAEKCISDDYYDDGVILDDVLDQYEVRMQSDLETLTQQIQASITQIKQFENTKPLEPSVKEIIKKIQEWDRIAQPLQLRSQSSGVPHDISEELGRDVRDLSLFLNNEKHDTEAALTLVKAMRVVFSELGELVDIFESDSDTLEQLLKGKKDAEKLLSELESIKNSANQIKQNPYQSNVGILISRIQSLNTLLKTIALDEDSIRNIRKNVCHIAREAAVDIHNSKHQTSLSLQIIQALYKEFYDIPEERSNLAADKQILENEIAAVNQANYSTRSTSSSYNASNTSQSGMGCLVVFIIIIIIAAIIGFSDSGSSSSANKPSNSSSSYSTSSEVKFSNSVSAGDKVYIDIVSITPEIGIYTEGSSIYSHFVCKCKTSSGTNVWVYMTTSEYKNNFDSSASTSVSSSYADTVSFSSSKRIHGVAKRAENIMTGLSTDTATMIMVFSSLK